MPVPQIFVDQPTSPTQSCPRGGRHVGILVYVCLCSALQYPISVLRSLSSWLVRVVPKRTKSADDDWGYVGPEDTWESVLTGALGGLIGKIPARDVWRIVDKWRPRDSTRADHLRLRQEMRGLGWEKARLRFFGGRPEPAYARGTPEQRQVMIMALRDPIFGALNITEVAPDGSLTGAGSMRIVERKNASAQSKIEHSPRREITQERSAPPGRGNPRLDPGEIDPISPLNSGYWEQFNTMADDLEPASPKRADSYGTTRFNALKHGVLSKYTVLPWEDGAQYNALLEALVAEYRPQGPTEENLVEDLAGIFWRKRRLRLGERAAHTRALKSIAQPEEHDETARAALVQVSPRYKGWSTASAISADDDQTEGERRALDERRTATRTAADLLRGQLSTAYPDALAALPDDIKDSWQQALESSRILDRSDRRLKEDAPSLLRFLDDQIVPQDRERAIALDHRPLIREQAFGDAVVVTQFDSLDRHEVHLDRKLERTLTMLLKLKELRRAEDANLSTVSGKRVDSPSERPQR